jgi:hypothetical protein
MRLSLVIEQRVIIAAKMHGGTHVHSDFPVCSFCWLLHPARQKIKHHQMLNVLAWPVAAIICRDAWQTVHKMTSQHPVVSHSPDAHSRFGGSMMLCFTSKCSCIAPTAEVPGVQQQFPAQHSSLSTGKSHVRPETSGTWHRNVPLVLLM